MVRSGHRRIEEDAMAGFSNEEELHRYVGGIFETALADPELSEKLTATGLVLRVRMTDVDGQNTIDLPGRTVHQGAGGPEPHATMAMDADTANIYWQGKVNLPMAMARKKVVVDGSMGKLLALAPLSKKLFPAYTERLRADGREDLIAS
jgi:putative sterol carrier protein